MPKILKSAIAAAILTGGVWCASVTPSYSTDLMISSLRNIEELKESGRCGW